MTLEFFNENRSYDPRRMQIRFFGYDGLSPVLFKLEVDAISPGPDTFAGNEASYLRAFDAKRDMIHSVASEAYGNKRLKVQLLTKTDFD